MSASGPSGPLVSSCVHGGGGPNAYSHGNL